MPKNLPSPGIVIIAIPGGRRVALFQAALARLALPPARVISWADVLAGPASVAEVVRKGDIVRLESPGRDFDVERAILATGADETDEEDGDGKTYSRINCRSAEALAFDKGRIRHPRQWFLGFRAALRTIARQLDECPPHRLTNPIEDVQVMFDKRRCHATLTAAGVAVPRALSPVQSFDELTALMHDAGWRRVFVKLAHGSSASGVVAYQVNAAGWHQAITTVEMVRQEGELRLYNSRRVRTYTDVREIAELLDALSRHRVHVERWIPKAGIAGRVFDLRVLVMGGAARQTVVRLSRTPLTNLHLLNDRADSEAVRRRMGEAAWNDAMASCERAMAGFPGSLHGGVDLLITPDFQRHAILEVNAFGDLLPGALWQGMDTYETQIKLMLAMYDSEAASESPSTPGSSGASNRGIGKKIASRAAPDSPGLGSTCVASDCSQAAFGRYTDALGLLGSAQRQEEVV